MKLGKLNVKEVAQRIEEAPTEEKSKAIVESVQAIVEEANKDVVAEYRAAALEVEANADNARKHGLRQLNKEEKDWIDMITDANQLAGAFPSATQEELIPETITNYVFEDLRQEHPILKHVNYSPAGVKTWMLSEFKGKATWGKLDRKIEDEITAELESLTLDVNKLSAFAFIPMGIVHLGHAWVEKYIREVLLEVTEDGIEEGIIAGDGKDAPIGLIKQLSGDSGGVYPDRKAEKITDFSVKSLGKHMMTLSDDGKRRVSKVLLIANPMDAYTSIAEASSFLNAVGEYKTVFPYNIEVVESVHVPQGKAILYVPNSYTFGINRQAISYSDHYQFLEDNRVFKVVTYGNGRLVKENQAVLLDISELEPLAFNVKDVSSKEVEAA